MEKIAAEGYNLNISRYVSTSEREVEIDLGKTNADLLEAQRKILAATTGHNRFLKELGLPLLPIDKEV